MCVHLDTCIKYAIIKEILSTRVKSFFMNHKISLENIMKIIYKWAGSITQK